MKLLWFLSSFLYFANAKTVHVKWEAIPGASQYEILIEREGKPAVQTKVKNTLWQGDLGFGTYVYQVRAVDALGHSGEWSQLNPIAVMPEAPRLVSPTNLSKLLLIQNQPLMLDWQVQEGVAKYLVEISKGTEIIVSTVVDTAEFRTASLAAGTYQWRVRGILQAGKAYPALEAKHWETKFSESREFSINYRNFKKPEIIYPVGDQWPSENGIIKFQWESVEGAEAYELRVAKKFLNAQNSNAPAPKEKIIISELNSASVNVGKEGTYAWSVRALTNVDAKKLDSALRGQESYAEFRLLRDYLAEGNTALIELSSLVANAKYKFTDQARNLEGSFNAQDIGLRLRSEYWFAPNWAMGAGIEDTFFNIDDKLNQRFSADALIKRRLDLSSGWFLSLALGPQGRQYPEAVLGNGSTDNSIKELNAFGGGIGADISKQLNERWSLRAKLNYFYPVYVSGVSLSSGNESHRNLSLGVQGLYWMRKTFGIGAGAFLDNRSLEYKTEETVKSIRMDGYFFFGSVIFRFENSSSK